MNKDYFPTPSDLIDKMLSKVDVYKYNNILEPSCGKGDIIDKIKEKLSYGRRSNIYGIEIEHQLRELVKNKCEIIGYDFLEYENSFIKFDLIVANFPFSNGVKHFLKAWEILDKGKLVCLVNAETVKNQFSKDRKLMGKILEDNNAEIEYIQNAFSDAERKTDVEVALIVIEKKETEYDNIFQGFQEDFFNQYTNLDGEISQNEIVVGNDKVDHIVKLNKILKIEAVKKAIANNRYSNYIDILSKTLENKGLKEIKNDNTGMQNDIRDKIYSINQRCWQYFFCVTDIRNKLTSKTYEQFIQEYQNSKIDFTHANIQRVKYIILASANKIQEENYIEVFDYLTKYREDNREHVEGWKTNSGYKLKKRWIIPYGVELSWDKKTIQCFDYRFREKLDDIDKVFCNLTGKDINNIKQSRDWFHYEDTEFFNLKCYKKGTVHFCVKDEYLEELKQFNLIVCRAKKWIGF